VVETDGLRYHRTPAQQARDRLRDQAHLAAGTTSVRFTHAQVRFEPEYVVQTLDSVARRLRAADSAGRSGLGKGAGCRSSPRVRPDSR
jgi:very-short-patch-repair endonuclease